jgi:hypothetical protein
MPTPQFLNVVLDIQAHADLQPLIDYWKGQLFPLVSPEDAVANFMVFQLNDGYPTASETIRHYCAAVENLPPDLLQFWYQCPQRILDIGYESGTERPILQDALPVELLLKVTRYFTSLDISLYPND